MTSWSIYSRQSSTACVRSQKASSSTASPHHPRAEALKKMLEDRGEEVHSVIGLEVADEELMERLIKRGAESGRSDDNPETIGNRLKVYHSTTSPLRDYYTAEGTYRAIRGSGRVDEIFSRITEAIESQTVLN